MTILEIGISFPTIVNQKQICLSGHAPQTICYVVSQQGHSIGNAWPKDERRKSPHQYWIQHHLQHCELCWQLPSVS
jgi:hypothetical protein